MRQLIPITIMLFAVVNSYAYEAEDLQGKWLIVTMQSESNGQIMEGDGTDYWEFDGDVYTVYSSGMKLSSTKFVVEGDKLIVKAALGDHTVQIVDIQSDQMQVVESGFRYTLIRQ